MDVNWALFGVSAVLAVITAVYVYETHQIVDRMDKERAASNRPQLTLHLVPWEGKAIKLRIQNVGTGPAFSIKGTIESKGAGNASRSVSWSYVLLTPGQYEEFGVPAFGSDGTARRFFQLDVIQSMLDEVKADLTYKSAAGDLLSTHEVIELKALADDLFDSEMMLTKDHPDRIWPRIAKALEDIKSELNRIK